MQLNIRERNALTGRKHLKKASLRIALVYPNYYRVGMSSLSTKLLYYLFNSMDGVFCERAFLNEQWEFPSFAIETRSSLQDMDVLAFTLQFELDYVNLIRILLASEIPPKASDRHDKTQYNFPLIIGGGPAISANPEPLSEYLDAIFIGEIEPVLKDLCSSFSEDTKVKALESLNEISGFYVPTKTESEVKRVFVDPFDSTIFPTAQIVTLPPFTRGTKPSLPGYLLQISRGCPFACKFCLVGHTLRPYRERSLETLKKYSEKGYRETEEKIAIIGSSAADHRNIREFLVFLNESEIPFSLPSVRFDSELEILDELVKTGQKTLTIAPESGSDAIRDTLGKKMSNDQALALAATAKEAGIRRLRLYFMLGTPESTPEEEGDSIQYFVDSISNYFRSSELRVTIAPFVPKAHTPFFSAPIRAKEVKKVSKRLTKVFSKKGVKITASPSKWAVIQALISLGGKEMGYIIEKVAREGGHHGAWRKSLGNPEKALEILRRRLLDGDIPWWRVSPRNKIGLPGN